eukprot:TRINITY_DN71355_c0_g1_i1.p1 TRINITY_DN71355_c0_g1~~TRINITY_DN71355_c0_g1_i1.p1  ORF type:complete len:248 (-),score=49.29 TRINITY_DN71355_c0_g1_i1:77-820(-)
MKSSFGNPSDKRVPENKKYSHIASSIDTGASAKKVSASSSAATARRRDEIFKRIKPATLVRLLSERQVCESVYALGSDPGDARSASSVVASKAAPITAPSMAAAASRAPASVASIGSVAGSVVSIIESDVTASEARDLVILDLREPEEYSRCHVPTAESYPAPLLNRDQFSADLHRCKRDPSKLLVVYHSNDQTTASAATLLVQKGWESAHALSGGFEELVQSYAEVLEGDPPARPETGSTVRSGRR